MSSIYEQIMAARSRLEPYAHFTPVMTSRTLNEIVGGEVFFKCENLQRIGAFKFRGAFNMMSQLTDEQKRCGVITYSSGNHGQAVALVGKLLGIRTVVVMPYNAPVIKREATESHGAEVVLCEASERLRIAKELEGKSGYTMVPPFDHEAIIAGQGTVALEFLEQVPGLNSLLIPCGGGGLLSGCAIAAKNQSASCQVIGIEPEVADDAARSFRERSLQTVSNPPTIADGVRTPSLGQVTFPLILEYVDGFATVSEQAIYNAVRFLFFRLKLVVEPSGVLGLAAVLSGAARCTGKIGIVLSGGNVDATTMTRILSS